MIDAMCIRQHVDFDHHSGTFFGYVDLGNGSDNTTEAKEALVFMLVGISGGWKTPVAYYFTKGLSAETQKELVAHCLDKIHEYGFEVHAITMDGHPTNISMCKLLGAELQSYENMTTYIASSQQHRTYVILDACHMIKLVRNTLQAYYTLISSDGTVSWKYIEDMHNTQADSSLRLANKLSSRHIHYQQQKMKVSLAVQVLSSSVAKALLTMLEIGDARFKDSKATVKFLEVIIQIHRTCVLRPSLIPK